MTGRVGDPVDILGVRVDPWYPDALIEAMVQSAQRVAHEPLETIHYANVHVINWAQGHRELREELNRASTVYCDGSGVQLASRVLGCPLPPRLTSADFIDALCARSAQLGIGLYLLGGAEGVAARAGAELQARHAGLRIVGTHHGFVDETTSGRVVEIINRTAPGILVVGMGTPIQELWVAKHRHDVEAPVVWSVGALLDFVSGTQRRAPQWLAKRHLEWLWRLGVEPRRMARRYVVGNPRFAARVLRQRLRNPSTR